MQWTLLGHAFLGSGGEICLYQRANEFVLRVDGRELMTSRAHGSEEALAELGCEGLSGLSRPRVLVGGLGMGFTLAACLRRLSAGAEVIVAELVPEVIAWNRGALAHLSDSALADPRVRVEDRDVAEILRDAPEARFDAILLDVDNGPSDLSRSANGWLYTAAGLQVILTTLRVGGRLAIWSADRNPELDARLRDAGFVVVRHQPSARGRNDDPEHTVWCARRQPAGG